MRDERGFTLVETMVAMALVGMVAAAICASIVVGLRTTDQTRLRIAQARDEQMTATYFIPDVESATNVSLTDATCAGATPLVRFRWTDQGVQHDVAYLARTVGTERRLTRRSCNGAAPATDVEVAHYLDPAVSPAVSCTPSCTSTPTKVTITVTAEDGSTFSVTGARGSS